MDNEAFQLVLLSFCFETGFTCYHIHHFKIHSLVGFNMITNLCNHHHYLIPGIFTLQTNKQNPTLCPLAITLPSPPAPLPILGISQQ